MDQQTLDELTAWIDAYADATDDTVADLVAAVLVAYEGVDPYSVRDVTAAAAQAADQSNAAVLVAAGIAAQYAAATTGIITETNIPTPPPGLLLLRGGADMPTVYTRPAKMVRRLVSQGVDLSDAWQRGLRALEGIADGNIRLAQRQALNDAMRALGVTTFRRIVRPELAKSGESCGLCIVASDVVYTTGVLMPIHANCNCTVMPIVGEEDPGATLNNLALGDLYDDAGGLTAEQLKRTRYSVNEHGEWGPVLTRAGDKFTGPSDLLPPA